MSPAEQRIVLHDIRWSTFRALMSDLPDTRGTRLAFDEGMLEIMSPSPEHESLRRTIGRLVEEFTLELSIDIKSGGSTTLLSELRKKGIEPDECYWVHSESQVRGKDHIDLAVDPPPDLAIEVDISPPAIDRFRVYAGLQVPELWIHDARRLQIFRLEGNGYVAVPSSVELPRLPIPDLERFLAQRHAMSETTLVRSWRAWAREHCGAP